MRPPLPHRASTTDGPSFRRPTLSRPPRPPVKPTNLRSSNFSAHLSNNLSSNLRSKLPPARRHHADRKLTQSLGPSIECFPERRRTILIEQQRRRRVYPLTGIC